MRLPVLVILWLSMAGCASPRLVQGLTPASVEELNAVLDGRTVTLETVEDRRITRAIDVEVVADEVRFRKRRSAAREESAPLREVERITYREGGGAGTGALLLGLPGGLVAFAGAAGAITSDSDLDTSLGWFVAATGVGLTLIGAVVGGVIGSMVAPGRAVVLYGGQPLEGVRPVLPAAPTPQPEVQGW